MPRRRPAHLAAPQRRKTSKIFLSNQAHPIMVRSAIALVFLLAACSTSPLTGRSQYMIVSDRMAMTQSAAAYTQMMSQLDKKKQVEHDTARVEKVREITDKLIAQAVRFRPDSANWAWEVKVINDPKVVNAFCMAGGKMAIYTGMWEKLKATDDEIAQVMGHEIAHALADHTRERMSIAMTSQVATQLGAIALASRENQGLAFSGLQLASVLAIQLPNSRAGEAEADQIGIELAARAGYDPKAAVTLWEKMGKEGGGKQPPEFLSTHPSPQNRAARLTELAAKVQPLYLASRDSKLDAPRFLSAKEGANERIVTRAGELSPREYADKVSREGDTLTFLAEPFERFKSGNAVFDCRIECALRYGARKSDWKKLHEKEAWRELAISVMQTGYLSDLAYFMLAEAAQGLGLKQAAKAYYQRAVEAGARYGCSAEGGFDCEGFEVQKRAHAALKGTS
jgi:Zn-dependent protease with chaperone function